jgi:Asp-tRNA(Asn)/Glu-tRNA(Gln) amidotransferase B subunit
MGWFVGQVMRQMHGKADQIWRVKSWKIISLI